MRRPSRRKPHNAHDPKLEELFKKGCDILSKQDKPNISKVSKDLHIPYDTLRHRFLGLSAAKTAGHGKQQLLSPEQEQVLVDWIGKLSAEGQPLSKRTIRKKASVLCGRNPGRGWIPCFLRRHPDIVLGKPSGLDPKRAQAFNRTVVGNHFRLLKEVLDEKDIPLENRYNMDEKGCQRGGGRKTSAQKYFVPQNRRPRYRLRSGNLELVTIIECVSADGTALLPGFVFSGKEFCPEWFSVQPDIWYGVPFFFVTIPDSMNSSISTSPNGWTDDFLCTEWFWKSFIPQATARNTSGKPILLIYDGHGSHETTELIKLARENNIILFCLPPHTTHKLQPLDVGVFGPFQRAWADRCDEVVEETGKECP
jgi:DDE superfamily endonuclease/Tc5 transposase DNA-binding domain